MILGFFFFIVSFLIIFIWPPSGPLFDSLGNICVVGLFTINLISGVIIFLKGYYKIKKAPKYKVPKRKKMRTKEDEVREKRAVLVIGFIIVLLSCVFIYVFPPSGSLFDSHIDILRIIIFIFSLSSGLIMMIGSRLEENRDDRFYSILIFSFYRLIGVWFIMLGLGIFVFFGYWLYSFWIGHTAPGILVFTPFIAIAFSLVLIFNGILYIIKGPEGYDFTLRVIEWIDSKSK